MVSTRTVVAETVDAADVDTAVGVLDGEFEVIGSSSLTKESSAWYINTTVRKQLIAIASAIVRINQAGLFDDRRGDFMGGFPGRKDFPVCENVWLDEVSVHCADNPVPVEGMFCRILKGPVQEQLGVGGPWHYLLALEVNDTFANRLTSRLA